MFSFLLCDLLSQRTSEKHSDAETHYVFDGVVVLLLNL